MSAHLYWLEKSKFIRLLDIYPAFKEEKRLRCLFVYLANSRPNDDGYWPLSSATLTRIYTGRLDANRRHDFSITKEVAKLKQIMPGLHIGLSEYRIKGSLATDVTELALPEAAMDIFTTERLIDRTGHLKTLGLIDTRTGQVVDAAAIAKRREDRLKEADDKNMECPYPETRAFLDFMNHALSPVMFRAKTQDVLNCDTYLTKAMKDGRLNDIQALATWRNLDEMLMLQQAFYVWTGHTKRIFSLGYGFATLHSPVRQRLYPDLIEVDLTAAQGAILCSICDVPLLRAHLEAGKSLWKYLLTELGFADDDDEMKAVIKIVFYSLCFGKSKRRLFCFENNDYRAHKLAIWRLHRVKKIFLAIPMIQELLEARDEILKEIRLNGGAFDCDGDWIPTGKSADGRMVNPRSVLGQLAQAMEWRLLEPLRREAVRVKDNPHGWRLLIWSHDGFSLRPRQSGDSEDIRKRLVRMVDDQAKLMNVPTRLEFKMLGR